MKKSHDVSKKAIALHKKLGGKIRVTPAAPVRNRADLALVYTPGVAAVSSLVANNPKLARTHTIKGRMVAVVSDGSAVLGLGNIGPLGALPVMEGKCALFKTFADVDAVPIVLDVHEPAEIIAAVRAIAPTFGGINLEDISAPKCFEIEAALQDLGIPVMHDDQHGTAVVVLAGLINALKVTKKKMKDIRVVVSGAGAAGVAVGKLLHAEGAGEILFLDRAGIISSDRPGISGYKKDIAEWSNTKKEKGGLREALTGADVLVGVSGPGLATAAEMKLMAPRAIVFALANPTPEIMPDEAKKGGAMVIATGRSDFPNQVNNSLAFPGIFRGALDKGITRITDDTKIRAARALAALVPNPKADKILPDMFDKRVAKAVAKAVR